MEAYPDATYGAGIFTYIWVIFEVNIPYMGLGVPPFYGFCFTDIYVQFCSPAAR